MQPQWANDWPTHMQSNQTFNLSSEGLVTSVAGSQLDDRPQKGSLEWCHGVSNHRELGRLIKNLFG